MTDNYLEQWASQQGQPAGAAPAPSSDYLTSWASDYSQRRDAALRASLDRAVMVAPDQAAKTKALANSTGLPFDTVERNQEEVARQQRVRESLDLMARSPILRDQMTDPEFAKLAHQDTEPLSALEFIGKGLGRLTIGGASMGTQAVFNASGWLDEHLGALAGMIGADSASKKLYQWGAEQRGIANRQQESIDYFFDAPKNNSTVSAIYSGLQSAGFNLMTLPAAMGAFAARGANAAASVQALFGAMNQGFESYSKARDKGQGILAADAYAAPDAAAEYFFEKWSDAKLFDDLASKSPFLKMLFHNLSREVLGEEATMLAQNANEWVRLNPEKSVRQFIDEQPEAMYQTLIATLVGVGVQTGAIKTLGGLSADVQQAQQAHASAEQLKQLLATAMGSQLRENAPDTFAKFMQQVTGENVYMDGRTLAELLNNEQGQALLQQIPEISEQLQTAMQGQSPVEIPVAKLAAYLPGTSLEQPFIENLRMGDNELSVAEAQMVTAGSQDMLNQSAQRILEQATDAEVMRQSADAVKQHFVSQLTSINRFTPDVNEAYASLMRSFYTVLGGLKQITPEQALAAHPYNITASGLAVDALQSKTVPLDGQSAAAIKTLNKDPHIKTLPRAQATTLRGIYTTAAQIKPHFDTTLARLADVVGGDVKLAPLKGTQRTVEKIKSDYNGDPSKIKDVLRGTIEVRSLADAQNATAGIAQLFNVLPTGQRNLLDPSVHPADGYRDAKFNVDMGNGVIAEVQVNIPAMLEAKKEAHAFYEERSALERTLKDEAREATPEELAKIASLNEKMRSIYEPAFAEALAASDTNALNAASETGAPLRRAEAGSNTLGGETSQATQYGTPGDPSETGIPSTSKNSAISETSEGSIADAETQYKQQRKLRQAMDLALVSRGAPEYATLDDFRPENLPDLLNKQGWAVLTAEDPGAQKATPEQNAIAMASLQADLQSMGVGFLPVVGKYGDVQNGYIVTGLTEEEALALGRKYGQESVLTRSGLVYGNGAIDPSTGVVEVYDSAPEDFYTEVPGTGAFFSVEIDFDARKGGVFEQSVSTRVPWGKPKNKTLENPLAEQLVVNLDSVKRNPALLAKFVGRLGNTISLRTEPGLTPEQQAENYINQMVSNLVWLHDQVPEAIRGRSKLWYDGARKIVEGLVPRYGGRYSDVQLSAVMAVMSPKMDWFTNVTLGERIVDIWDSKQEFRWTDKMTEAAQASGLSAYPEDVAQITGKTLAEVADSNSLAAKWVVAYDLAYNPREYRIVTPEGQFADLVRNDSGSMSRAAWGNGYGPVAKAVSVLKDPSIENISAQLGTKHKVRNFYNNIYAPNARDGSITADTHAVAAALLLPLSQTSPAVFDNFGGAGSDSHTGVSGTYPIYAEAYRRAAAIAGVLPREMQSITWEAVRGLFKPEFKRAYGRNPLAFDTIWSQYHDGAIDLNEARQQLLALAGNIDNPAWHGRDSAGPRESWSSSYTGELLAQSGLDGTTGAGVGSDAASRAAALGRVDLTGVHYSKLTRTVLNGAMYGTGLKGLESDRVMRATDTRLRNRVYFYVDEGKGIRPEGGVGGIAHQANLTNLYDAKADPLRLWRGDVNDIESRVLDAGFNGYYIRNAFNQQGAAVLLGDAAKAVEAQPIANPATGALSTQEGPQRYTRGLLSSEIGKLDMATVQAAAPSAKLRSGNFSVDNAEFEAAQAAARAQGVELPGQVLNQSLAEDAQAQSAFLTERARAAGYDTVDAWVANDVGAFMKAAEEWRQKNPADVLTQPKKATPPRGTFDPRTVTTTMLADADLSTFLHETGHFFLDTLTKVASEPGAPVTVLADVKTVLDWFGVKDLATWNNMSLDQQRTHHERFAEAFELYLFEGKAPSRELQPLFARFQRFLVQVYKSLSQFMQRRNLRMSDEVRGVFDRMIASEEEINAMQEQMQYEQLFASKPEGMSDADWVAYREAGKQGTVDALEKLQSRSLRDLRWVIEARAKALREISKDVKAKRKVIEQEVTAEVDASPEMQAKAALDQIGAAQMTDGEMDLIAARYGFDSADAMLKAIDAFGKRKDAIEGMTDQRMLERHGEMATPQGMERAAIEAVHNEARARALTTELAMMREATSQTQDTGRTAKNGRRITSNVIAEAAKNFAARLVGERKVRDLKPNQFVQAERRAAKRAAEASASGNTTDAIQAKQDQVLNFYTAREMMAAQKEIDRTLRYLRKIAANETLPAEYKEQIDKLLERVELKERTLTDIDKRAKLNDWVKSQEAIGIEVELPDYLLEDARLTNYREMTVDQLRGLRDTIKQIEHLGRLKDKLLTAQDKREFGAAMQELAEAIKLSSGNKQANTRMAVTTADRAVAKLSAFGAAHIKVASWARIMDSGKDGGPVWERMVRPANAATDRQTKMRAEVTQKLAEIEDGWFKNKDLNKKVVIPGVFKQGVPRGPNAVGSSFTHQELLGIALNVGNEGNLQRLMGGEGWNDLQVNLLLSQLSRDDLARVQKVWDLFESYRPEMGELEKRVFGKEPEWVAPSERTVSTKDGHNVTLRGGYFPIKYDPRASIAAQEHADAESAKRQLQNAYSAATVRRGFLKSRAEEVTGRPLTYSLETIHSALEDTIHYLCWQEWLVDMNRMLRRGGIASTILDHYGPDVLQQFKSWRDDIAEGEIKARIEIDTAAGVLRQHTSFSGLAFNITSAAMQGLGATQSIVRIGAHYFGKGLMQYVSGPVEMTRKTNEMSEFMASRTRTRYRELNELTNQVRGQTGIRREMMINGYWLMAKAQQMVDVPTWLGAYEKAITEGNEEKRAIALADQAVIDSQGGGQVKDLSAIERGHQTHKLFTVFYSFMNTALNLGVMSAKTPKSRGKLAADMLMLYTVPAVLGMLLKNALTPGDSGDDKDMKKLARKLAAEQVSYLMGLMVFTREVGDAAKWMIAGDKPQDYAGPAGLRSIEHLYAMGKQATQGEFDDAFRKAAVNLLGDVAGVPSAQVNRTITGAKALKEGKTHNPMALAFGYQEPH